MSKSLSKGTENSRTTSHRSILRKAASTVTIMSLLVLSLSFVPRVFAPTSVSIGNGTQLINGTYLNAQKIANNLVFTSITVLATGQISIVDDVDLSTSLFGTPHFHLSLVTPTINFIHNMNLNSSGNLFLTTNTLNLDGRITSGGKLVDSTRLIGTATQVNVLSSAGSIQQAMDSSSRTVPVNVQISAGQYNESLAVNKPLNLIGIEGTATGSDPTAPEISGTQAGGNVISVNANNVTVDGLHLNSQVGDGSVTGSGNGVYASSVDNVTITHNTLEGFSGSGISTPASTNVHLNANLSPSITASNDVSTTQGNPGLSTINAVLLGGISNSLSCLSGLPAGVSCVFSPSFGPSTFSSSLTINTTSSTPVGSYTITVGTGVYATTFVLNVCPLLSGDANGDCVVNIFDLAIVGVAFGSDPSSANWNPRADLNGDGIVNIFDLTIVGAGFGQIFV